MFRATPCSVLLMTVLATLSAGVSSAEIVAVQGEEVESVHTNSGKSVGLAVVRYGGNEPLRLELRTKQKRACARGFAVALSDARDFSDEPTAIPTLQNRAMRKAEKLQGVDYLKIATKFADCMLKYGRDRYGKVHSPLFAVLLTRENEPRIGPYPLFKSPSPYQTSNMKTPFRKFDYNCVLNYPGGLGGEGPHKVTFYGCDPYEDCALYEMLIDLSRSTGNAEYREEAEKALTWWFTNTQGPTGLYPWGEHLGWDFEHECPTYFEGPTRHLYAACYHEIKDRVPFLDVLARIPAKKPGDHTPLEKYALGVWRAHYWDPARAVYCRHGDYTGNDKRDGSLAGFPAHQGAHLRLWVATYLNTRNPEVRNEMERILNKVLDVQIARTKRYGFVPFTFDPDYKGKDPGKSSPEQSMRLAGHAAELSRALSEARAVPEIAAKLKQLAILHLGPEGFEKAAVLEEEVSQIPKPEPRVKDLSQSRMPNDYANEILRNIEYYKRYGDDAYLQAADTCARLAYVAFCDDVCPLPKAYAGSPPKTTQGEPFPDFYFRGAKLMRAFALLGEATGRTELLLGSPHDVPNSAMLSD